MSAQARARASAPVIAARTRELAARLAGVFEQDQRIVLALNAAHAQLTAANDRLGSGAVIDPFGVHDQVHGAFCVYQQAAERRRQLAVDVGELSAWLTSALEAAGYSARQARSADVHELAAGVWPPVKERGR